MNSGVYVIKNTENGKFYVGSSCELDVRQRAHFSELRCEYHHNIYLQREFVKYGEGAFEFEVIVLCDEDDRIWIEQVYLDRYWNEKVLYNMNPDASKPPMTEETKAKIGAANRGRPRPRSVPMTDATKEKLRQANLGKKASAETRRKMSEAGRGRVWSQASREKLSKSRMGQQIGEKNPNGKLRNEDVWEIRRLWATGKLLQKEIAVMWRIRAHTVSNIVHRNTWKHI